MALVSEPLASALAFVVLAAAGAPSDQVTNFTPGVNCIDSETLRGQLAINRAAIVDRYQLAGAQDGLELLFIARETRVRVHVGYRGCIRPEPVMTYHTGEPLPPMAGSELSTMTFTPDPPNDAQ